MASSRPGMSGENPLKEDLDDEALAFRTQPELYDSVLLPQRTIKILMVTDGMGSFDHKSFGLRTLITSLGIGPGPWARFEVTTAHRDSEESEDSDIPKIRFDQMPSDKPLDSFDEIWLFGVNNRSAAPLTEKELGQLSRFMDGGGGVFATGDHQDMGVALCGLVPRVRNMRKWYFPKKGPNGEPVAPKFDEKDRLDTLRRVGKEDIEFGNQSDDVPQDIIPKMYVAWPSHHPYFFPPQYPHPLLCGPQGVIRVLPDHPHEGECYEPDDLHRSFTFDGYTIEEYPVLEEGCRLAPEVIAWSSLTERSRADLKHELNFRRFGAISTYDGHRVHVGRVVCDATWHHFFNVNLVGDKSSTHPVWRKGFLYSESGQAVLAEIRSYFRNIAIYLAPRICRAEMAWRAVWTVRWDHQVVISFDPDAVSLAIEEIPLVELLRVGMGAREALERMASPCQVLTWMLDLVELASPQLFRELEPLLDPQSPREPSPELAASPIPFVEATNLLHATLGATLYVVAQRFPEPTLEARGAAADVSLEEIAQRALATVQNQMIVSASQTDSSLNSWNEVLRTRRHG